jgi:hypothetical protein
MLADAVRASDIIFTAVTTKVDLSQYHDGKGSYSGTVTPRTFLKGRLAKAELNLVWEPSATGIEPGSNHVFFVRSRDGRFDVVKEIYVHKAPYLCSRTYWVYDGGTEATIQSIRLLVAPAEPLPDYAATLIADLKQDSGQRQATAVMLACETLRPECLAPLLFAVSNHVAKYIHAVYGACRLDGEQGASAALALLLVGQGADVEREGESVAPAALLAADERLVFDAISAAKNPKSVPILDQFGTDHPDYRVSCAFAIREIEPSKLPDAIRRWRADGKHKELTHDFRLNNGWFPVSLSADTLLEHALTGTRVFDER